MWSNLCKMHCSIFLSHLGARGCQMAKRCWKIQQTLEFSKLHRGGWWQTCADQGTAKIWQQIFLLQGIINNGTFATSWSVAFLMWITFYIFQGTFSIVLVAIVDASYRFVMVDAGAPGRHSDGGVFKATSFGRQLQDEVLVFPVPARLPRSRKVAPHVFDGDEAFQLRPDFMRPYPGKHVLPAQRVFNYRLSRARYREGFPQASIHYNKKTIALLNPYCRSILKLFVRLAAANQSQHQET